MFVTVNNGLRNGTDGRKSYRGARPAPKAPDYRKVELIEHRVATLVGQRVFGIALGYEDLNDHDELRRDPVMAVLAGKLEAAPGELRTGGGEVDPQPS